MKDETKNLETLDPNYILYQPNKIELETADYTDLDEKIDSLHFRTEDNQWACEKCAYKSVHKTHVKEHVERHIQYVTWDPLHCLAV